MSWRWLFNDAVQISDCLVNWYDDSERMWKCLWSNKVLLHHPRVKSRKTLQSGYLVTWTRAESGICLHLDLLLFEPGYPVSFYNMKGLILNGLLVSKSRSILMLQMEVTAVTTLNRKLQKADERWSSNLRIWWGACSPWIQKTSRWRSAVREVGWKMGGWLNAT